MTHAALISIEGVISEDMADLPLAQAIPEGLALYHALASQFRLHISSTWPDETRVLQWLKEAGIRPDTYQTVYVGEEGVEPLLVRHHHFSLARRGADLRYVVDSDPAYARFCLGRGVTPLCCPHPAYSRYSFLPDSDEGTLSWNDITNTLLKQAEVKEDDRRLDEEPQVEEEDDPIYEAHRQ